MKRSLMLAASAAALVTISVGAFAAANAWYPYKIEVWEKAFDMASPRHLIEYTPLDKGAEMEALRLVPAHEGRLLAGR